MHVRNCVEDANVLRAGNLKAESGPHTARINHQRPIYE